MKTLGESQAKNLRLRDVLREGDTDLWLGSDLRESSLWGEPTFVDQIVSLVDSSKSVDPDKVTRESRVGVRLRAAFAWFRSFAHSVQPRKSRTLNSDIIFVQYWPTPVGSSFTEQAARWQSPYFQTLPSHLVNSGLSVGFLHLHAQGPVTKPPKKVRMHVKQVNEAQPIHILVSDFLSPRGVSRAFRTWRRISRRLPSDAALHEQVTKHADLQQLWPWWSQMLHRSVRGSHGVRTALLTEMFGQIVRRNSATKLWIIACEGQSWEPCLMRHLDSQGKQWLSYVHTMMRPWDMRVRSLLSEYPPKRLAVHGPHDYGELKSLGVPLIEVEALRYQHLIRNPKSATSADLSTRNSWLVVGGADCAASRTELSSLLQEMQRRSVSRNVVIRWHPQCTLPTDFVTQQVSLSSESLELLAAKASVAFMVGRAAPLDTYLSGVPSCSLAVSGGLAMSPIPENEVHHTAITAASAVTWMLDAEQRTGFQPPIADYFVLDPTLPRWLSLIGELS